MILGNKIFNFKKSGAANTPLALIHRVNFKIESVNYSIEEEIIKKHNSGEIDKAKLDFMIRHYNNVVKQIDIKWRVIK